MGGGLLTKRAVAGTNGFDTNTKLTATTAKALRQAGFEFAIRYLSRKAKPSLKDLTVEELDIILDAGLAVMAVQHVAAEGWTPTEALGVQYGGNAAAHATAIGLSQGSSVWLDLEGIAGGTPAEDVVAYCNAWFKEVEGAGFTTGVYVGANAILSGDELYLRLRTKHYWKSGSTVPDIPHRGYCMVQHIIAGDKVGGVEIDRNVTFVDAFGSAPMLVTRGSAAEVAGAPEMAAPAAAMAAPAAAMAAPAAGMAAPAALAALVMQPADPDLAGMDPAHANPALAGLAAPAVAASAAGQGDEAILRELARQYDLASAMETLIAFRNARGAPMSARFWAIADFDMRSSEPRLFLFDVRDRQVQPYLCAHGKGSEGPTDDGYASVFSNRIGSNCTSLGVYACAETYIGKHGYSMRLDGLQPTNSNARARAVVMHGANYVSPETIRQTGRIGRSDGCLALENRYVDEVVRALTGGSLVLAWSAGSERPGVALADFVTAGGTGEVWSELEPPPGLVAVMRPVALAAAAAGGAAALAQGIQASPKVRLARTHASGVADDANAFQNIVDTAAGRAAHRSSYGNAPGGTVNLDPNMLGGVLALAEMFSFSVSEFCGGSHDPKSRHYAGCTVDVNVIDGEHVGSGNGSVRPFMQRCRELGATELLGPGDPHHGNHVHAGWPRPR